jgi:ubiquinone/menaquinone biosynthesis C-methylase UbiE
MQSDFQFHHMLHYYASTDESKRLTRIESELELLRTRDIFSRYLPVPPAIVLDVGGGPAVHSYWLAERGYLVHLVDIVPAHIELAQAMHGQHSYKLQSIQLGNACNLTFESESVEAIIMLGPLYHLTKRNDRIKALQEAFRVLQPGGILLAGAISRYIPLVKVLTRNLLDQRSMSIARQTAYTGQHRPDPDQDFFTTAFFHHPSGLEREIKQAGFEHCITLAVEGPARLLGDRFNERWSHPETRQWLLDMARSMEADRSLLGVSGHIICVARKPA